MPRPTSHGPKTLLDWTPALREAALIISLLQVETMILKIEAELARLARKVMEVAGESFIKCRN